MDIRTAMAQLVVIQGGLSITSPISASIKKAYTYFPKQDTLPDSPCFMNSWTLVEERRSPALRTQLYTIHSQLFVYDADQDRAADIASAFHVALVDALDGKQTLNSTVTTHKLRGGSPTLALLERGNKSYIGLDLFIDLVMSEAKTFA